MLKRYVRKYRGFIKKGHHRLNGKELLGYARFRHDPEGDFGRVRRQQQVMQTLKKELITPSTIVKLPKVAGILRGYINTDMPNSAIFQTGLSFGIRGDKNVETLTVPLKILIKISILITMVVH